MFTRSVVTLSTMIVLAGGVLAAGDESGFRRVRLFGQAQSVSKIVFSGDPAYPTRCLGAPAAVIGGAGLTNEQSQFLLEQSHCLGAAGTFTLGEFKFTGVDGSELVGRYFGELAPTVTSVFGDPPGGAWNVIGNLCIEEGDLYRRVADDCAADHYFPARGLLNLGTGDATIFIDYPLGVKGPKRQ